MTAAADPDRTPAPPEFPAAFRIVCLVLACVLVAQVLVTGNDPGNADLFPPPWDKLVHVCFYATVAGLLLLANDLRAPAAVFAVTVAVGVVDELVQTQVPTRHADLLDLAMDALGALAAVTIYRAMVLSRSRRPGLRATP
jgi:VanZ family protein